MATFWSKLKSEEREKHSAAQKNRVILEGLCEMRRVEGKNHDEMEGSEIAELYID